MAASPISGFTPAQYLEMERASQAKHEYVDGHLYAMAGGSPAHAYLAAGLIAQLYPQARRRNCRVAGSDFRVRVRPEGPYFYPDITVTCGDAKTADEFNDNLLNPTLIAEIVSRSTGAFDRGEKFADYRKLDSLREYVLVSAKKPWIESFLLDAAWKWVLTTFSGIDAICQLESIGCEISLAELYEGIALD